jgi:hypothetical protein
MTFRVQDTTTICIDTCFSGPFQSLAFHMYEAPPYVPRHNMPCCFSLSPDSYLLGDANADGVVDVADIVYLVNFLYTAGGPPDPIEAGDANCDTIVNIGDVVYLVAYLYKGGDPPGCP